MECKLATLSHWSCGLSSLANYHMGTSMPSHISISQMIRPDKPYTHGGKNPMNWTNVWHMACTEVMDESGDEMNHLMACFSCILQTVLYLKRKVNDTFLQLRHQLLHFQRPSDAKVCWKFKYFIRLFSKLFAKCWWLLSKSVSLSKWLAV